MRKFIALFLALIMVFCLCACGQEEKTAEPVEASAPVEQSEPTPVKIGLICLHDENSTYDINFINAFKAACEKTGVEYLIKTNAPENSESYDAAVDLAENGCNIVFADSFGHEDYILQAADEFPDVQFCHATGTEAHTAGRPNFHNAFAMIFEGRYLDGVAAGMKLNEMIEAEQITPEQALVGYVGAHPYAEVISGYTSFFLGVRSVCPEAEMQVTFTGSWYDETAEKEAANRLIGNGCVIISGHADSMGAPTACEASGVPFVFYNGALDAACPNTYIVSTKIDWQPYFEYIINCMKTGEEIAVDWVGSLNDGSVVMTEVNKKAAAPGTDEAIAAAREKLMDGTLHVFDTSTFTVGGKHIDSYMADVDTDEDYEKDTEAISGGCFHESEFRSAPYFDIPIDGIILIDN